MFESLLSYGPITEHWFLSILAIIICSFVPKTQRVARGTGLTAIGIFLIWLLMLICHPSGHYEVKNRPLRPLYISAYKP